MLRALFVLAVLLGLPQVTLAAPKRVVSMNLCTDQLAMLVGPDQLISVSYLSQDPRASAMVEDALAYPANRGLAEDIFVLKPDLVIASTYTNPTTVSMLKRLGIRVAELAPVNSLQDVRLRIEQMGALLGRTEQAKALIARFDQDLSALRPPTGPIRRAATYEANSYTSGMGTLASAVIEAAGLTNIAAELGFAGGGRLPLESLVMARPDLVISGQRFGTPALAEAVLAHPALRAIQADAGVAPVADRDWICGTPHVLSAIRRLVQVRNAMMDREMRYPVVLGVLGSLVAVLFVASLLVGPAALDPWQSLRALVIGGEGVEMLVMREIRLPRAILGAMIGASLGLSGAALQGYLRNPLAEPGLIGVSASAALGAVIAIYTGLSAWFPLALPLLALAGAVLAVLLVLGLSGAQGGSLTLILAGIAITSLAGALTSLALNLSPNPFAALEIVFWLLGSLTDRSMLHVWLSAPFMLAGWAVLAGLGRGLDALTLGEEAAASLGTNLTRLRLAAVLGTAASVGAATAVAGTIGFVGLVVPHLLRPLVGARPSRLLAASALGGAAMLLAADLAVRLITPANELKLGVLTALVGAPFFLWMIFRVQRRMT